MNTNSIEKTVFLHAPRSRVWRAIADAQEFGRWFRVDLEVPFVEGKMIRGKITYPGAEHLTMIARVERIEPERYFAYRWHPAAVDPTVDYSTEPMTSNSAWRQPTAGQESPSWNRGSTQFRRHAAQRPFA